MGWSLFPFLPLLEPWTQAWWRECKSHSLQFVLSILNHLPWKGEFKIFPAACLYCSYITFTLTSIKYISYFYKTVLRNFSFLGCNQAWKCTTLLFSSTVNTSNIKHLFNLVSLVVHSIYLAFPFSLGIQESGLLASEVSSDGYLQFLFAVLFEVKSITACAQTDFPHLTLPGLLWRTQQFTSEPVIHRYSRCSIWYIKITCFLYPLHFKKSSERRNDFEEKIINTIPEANWYHHIQNEIHPQIIHSHNIQYSHSQEF